MSTRFTTSVPTAGPTPSDNAIWPLPNAGSLIVPERSDPWSIGIRAIGATRENGSRGHAGVDLYGAKGDPIVAVDDGTVVAFYHFYRGTYALLIEHDGYVVNYGEVDIKSRRIGDKTEGTLVKKGEKIAVVGKMFRSSMLHFEMYASGTERTLPWNGFPSGSPPSALRDPTEFLLTLRDRWKEANPSTVTTSTYERSC